MFRGGYLCRRLLIRFRFPSAETLSKQVVKVFVSVFGDERGKEVAIAGLKAKAKYVRSELGRRMKLRLTPEIRFIQDDSFERGSRVFVAGIIFWLKTSLTIVAVLGV